MVPQSRLCLKRPPRHAVKKQKQAAHYRRVAISAQDVTQSEEDVDSEMRNPSTSTPTIRTSVSFSEWLILKQLFPFDTINLGIELPISALFPTDLVIKLGHTDSCQRR
mmetsp:Transcript_31649/g.76805  ORF Transcript_31649/g.76805 Transcript_31649/m.76805 type:complete len:108 (-) Transcript_31649:4679-5002(-)